MSPSKSPWRPLLILMSLITCLITTPSLVSAQTCRTRCVASEIIDAYGCCAPLELGSKKTSAPDVLPDVITREDQHARPVFRLRAYHMIAQQTQFEDRQTLIARIIAQTKNLKEPARLAQLSPMEQWQMRDSLSVMAWEVWATFEHELRVVYEACNQPDVQSDEAQTALCIKDLHIKLNERDTWISLARPLWQEAQAPAKDEALAGEPLIGAIRAQAMFYQAAVELAAGQANQGFTLVKALIAFDPESPYTALAIMSLGDFFLETGSPKLAAPFYLKAARHTHNPVSAYAYYRHGLCLVALDSWQQGMRMFIKALEEAQKTGTQQPGIPLLTRDLTEDVISLYAQTGAPENAATFFDALGIPATLVPIYLTRLRDAYTLMGRKEAAAVLTKTLDEAQESSPGEGTSIPFSR